MPLDFENPVRLHGASRSFGSVHALTDVDFTVAAGSSVGLLGPNGSGKTTLLSLIAGLRVPTSGTVTLFGCDPRDPRARVRLGVTPQHSGIVKNMTVSTLVLFISRHFVDHVPPADLLGTFGLDHLADKVVGGLSGGQQRLLSVALAFVGRPRLVLLDEPSTGLDVLARSHLWDAVKQHSRQGVSVLLTSHYLEEIQMLSDRIVMMRQGQIVADGRTVDVLSSAAPTTVRVTTDDDRALALPGALEARRDGDVVVLSVRDASVAVKALAQLGVDYSDIDIQKPSLDDAFAQLSRVDPS